MDERHSNIRLNTAVVKTDITQNTINPWQPAPKISFFIGEFLKMKERK